MYFLKSVAKIQIIREKPYFKKVFILPYLTLRFLDLLVVCKNVVFISSYHSL